MMVNKCYATYILGFLQNTFAFLLLQMATPNHGTPHFRQLGIH